MIELRDVRRVFHQGRPDELVAVDGVSLRIAARRTTVLRGPSGSGKTSLLALVGCMARPTSGRMFLDGKELTSLPERFLTAIRRTTFGFVFQQFHLLPGVPVLENVMLPAYPLGGSRRALERRARSLLELLRVEHRARARADWLSGGEAQRVAIARALVNQPKLLLLDEPFGALDALTKIQMQQEILRIWEVEQTTMVLVTHDIDEAIYLGDRVVIMSNRPGTVKRLIPVALPRPRDRSSFEFVRLRKEIYAEFFAEAEKPFAYAI